jgi:hypothetical protein
MDIFRRLERRLESLLDGVIGSVFRGPLHPTELAGKVAREADLGAVSAGGVVTVPNRFVLSIHPDDLDGTAAPRELVAGLEAATEDYIVDRGWRADGPVTVEIRPNRGAPHGNPRCTAERFAAVRPRWAVLRGPTEVDVRVNHAVVGRGLEVDVPLDSGRVSRRHARLWREGDRIMLIDLGSSNGTLVDGVAAGTRPVELILPTVLTFGDAVYRLSTR